MNEYRLAPPQKILGVRGGWVGRWEWGRGGTENAEVSLGASWEGPRRPLGWFWSSGRESLGLTWEVKMLIFDRLYNVS